MSRDRTKPPKQKSSESQRVKLALLLSLLALVSVTAASVAWFTIADFTKVYSMSMDITSGTNLRFDLDAHQTFEEYVRVLTFQQIADRLKKDRGYDMRKKPLEPVTTANCESFFYQDGRTVNVNSGAYLDFTLHFFATSDMYVHLTSANGSGEKDGTSISSSNRDLPGAMRISFTIGQKTYVYEPDRSKAETIGGITYFGLPASEKMELNDDNNLFFLPKETNQPVQVRVWLEGTDPACDDGLRAADYRIRLRFIGTDENNRILDGSQERQ